MRVSLIAGALAGALFTGASYAQSIGAPVTDVKKGTFGVELEYGKQEFKLSRGNFAPPNFDYDITDLKTTTLRASYAFADGIALSFRAGQLSGGSINGKNQNGTIRGTDVDGDLFGIGLDALLWQRGALAVGLTARYTQYGLEGGETRNTNVNGRDNVDLTSTQGGLGVSYTGMGAFRPYAGVVGQKINGKTVFVRANGTVTNENPLKQRDSMFFYAGLRYQTPWRISVGAEVASNSSWYANVGINF